MNHRAGSRWIVGTVAVALAIVLVSHACGQDPTETRPPGERTELSASKALTAGAGGAMVPPARPQSLWKELLPELNDATLTWIAVVVILVLTLQTRPLLTLHNLDGILLALVALLLPLRNKIGVLAGDPTNQTVQSWVFALLTLIGLYYLFRGLQLLHARQTRKVGPNVSEGAMVVLTIAGLAVALTYIGRAPISEDSRDALIGGICMAETGKLPYGDAVGHDARSPLLYALHAGAVKLIEPSYETADQPVVAMTWTNRQAWLDRDIWDSVDPTPVRMVNAMLFLALVIAVAGIGHRQHSIVVGQTIVAILCIFPGAVECLARPEIMLAATLFAWSIALLKLPGLGSILSLFVLILAGLAWPWAWLAVPAFLAYFLRQGFHAVGALIGLLGGVAVTACGLMMLTDPTIPRDDGALARAGIQPNYSARLSDDGTVVIEHAKKSDNVSVTFKSRIWSFMVESEDARLAGASMLPALPNGVDAASVMYRDIAADASSGRRLQGEYRVAMADEPALTRGLAVLRTLLEATWIPHVAPDRPFPGTWDLWSTSSKFLSGQWIIIRRCAKVAIGLLALLVAFLLIRGEKPQMHQLVGGVLAISAGVLVVSFAGPTANWIWLMPPILAALAANSTGPQSRVPSAALNRDVPPPISLGPAPRITVED